VGLPPAGAAEYQPAGFWSPDLGRSKQIQEDPGKTDHIAAKKYSYLFSLWKKAART
jgi:hypothetical protein